MFYRTLLSSVALTAAIPITLTTMASADVVTSSYISSTKYHFELEHMPDFDQVRDEFGQSSNGVAGGMYCNPAAATNLMGYISTHGFPGIGLVAADWENDEDYDIITAFINNMGILSDTDPVTGSSHANIYDAIVFFLDDKCPGIFTVTENLATPVTGPTLHGLTQNALNGSITRLGHGRYSNLGTDIFGRTVLNRTGGHAVAFVRGYRSNSDQEIGFRDPGDDWADTTQSNFVTDTYDVEDLTFVRASSVMGAAGLGSRTASRIMQGSSTNLRILDSAIHIRPRSGYSWRSSEKNWKINFPDGFGWWSSSPTWIPGPLDTALIDFTIGPFNNSIWYVDSGNLSKASKVKLSNHEVNDFNLPHDAKKIAFARDHTLLALGTGVLSRMHPLDQSSENAPETVTVQIPGQPEYLSVDDTDDSIWLGDLEAGQASQYPQTLDMPGRTFPFPDHQVPFVNFAITGNPEMPLALVDATGLVLLCKPDTAIDQLVPIDEIWTDGTISSLQFNDEGDLMTFNDDGMRMYRRTLAGWSEVNNMPFDGTLFTARSVMSRNRTNFDPTQHIGNGWHDDEPLESVPGDLNQDGVVGIDDLLTLLAVFGQSDDQADLDGDGIVGINDLLELLAGWTP